MIKCCVIAFLPYHHSVATTKRLVYTVDSVETANILDWVLVLLRPRVMKVITFMDYHTDSYANAFLSN
jgi:hypothetical protein